MPVKVAKPQADAHRNHVESKFAVAIMFNSKELASYLGQQEVIFITQDDESRVVLGITTANKQSPILMHLEYQATLTDQDWVVAKAHILIPLVYEGIVIDKSKFASMENRPRERAGDHEC